jgi:hypothetical protein
MVACRTSVVNEHVPASRLELGYLRGRYKMSGYVYSRSHILYLSKRKQYLSLARSSLITLLCSAYPLAMPLEKALGFSMFAKFWTHIGIVQGALTGWRAAMTEEA